MKIVKRVMFLILFIICIPIIVAELIIKFIIKIIKKRKWQKQELDGHKLLLSNGITDIDLMEGYMFEDYLKILLFYSGFKVQSTQKSKDYGADLLLTDVKLQTKIIVQAKRYSKPVGSRAVQEVLAAKIHYKADDAWVITNNIYTPQAEQLAKENQIRLIDRNELIEMYTSVCNQFEIENSDGKNLYQKTDLSEKYPYYI